MPNPLGSSEFLLFAEQLRQLLASDFPLSEGLAHFSRELQKPAFRQAVERVANRLGQGLGLASALEAEGQPFSPEFIGLIRAGEESGNLLEMLDTALEHEHFMGQLEKELEASVYYPALVYGFSLLSFAGVMVWAYPVLVHFYAIAGQQPPFLFRAIHSVFYGPWGLLAALWIGTLFLLLWSVKARYGLASLALHLPGIGRLVADVFSARIAKSLGLLLQAGVSLKSGLAAVAASTGDPGMKRRLLLAAHQVGEGYSLSQALGAVGLSKARLSDLVLIGEESGTLPRMLVSAAGMFRAESEANLEAVMRVTGAVLLVAVGGWILLLLSSWFHAYSLIPRLPL